MTWDPLPPSAAWTHRGARDGFEVSWFDGAVLTGCTTGLEEGRTWAVEYEIRVDGEWRTREARVRGRTGDGVRSVVLTTDGVGRWQVDGAPAPHLDGCLDVDLESSAMTNTLPVHRLGLRPGERGTSAAAWVRAGDLSVERLDQGYVALGDRRFDYDAPSEDFAVRIVYDAAGLALEYPEIAVRAG
ncbi:putative glycolipid-binding domain-containing protein [Blastococcus sp. SYSU D00669]